MIFESVRGSAFRNNQQSVWNGIGKHGRQESWEEHSAQLHMPPRHGKGRAVFLEVRSLSAASRGWVTSALPVSSPSHVERPLLSGQGQKADMIRAWPSHFSSTDRAQTREDERKEPYAPGTGSCDLAPPAPANRSLNATAHGSPVFLPSPA